MDEIEQDEVIVSESTTLFKFGDRLIYIPNPVQTAMLIKKISNTYDKGMLNPAENVEKYSTGFRQAVNVGIFGTDLGYITTNNQNQDAMTYLGAVKKLTDELGISSSFNFEKLGKSSGNQK